MKKCKGCGIDLQNEDINKVGYIRSFDQDYCQRCFRLSHYGDTDNLHIDFVNNEKTLSIYEQYKQHLFVVIIDVLDLFTLDQDNLLDIFKDYHSIIIINKVDLLPDNISQHSIDNFLNKTLIDFSKRYNNIVSAIITHKKDSYFNDIFYQTLKDLNIDTVVFAGRSNAGKTTIINKLINNDTLTISLYPSTTLADNVIEYENYHFIDTPGLIDFDNYSTYINEDMFKLFSINKTIKPKTYQLDSYQSYFFEGLLRVDVFADKDCSITFYLNNNIRIHRSKYDNADKYYKSHYDEFVLKADILEKHSYKIDKNELFVIKGLGLFKVTGNTNINIYTHPDVTIYIAKGNL